MELEEAELRIQQMSMEEILERAAAAGIKIPSDAIKEEALKILMAYFECDDVHEENCENEKSEEESEEAEEGEDEVDEDDVYEDQEECEDKYIMMEEEL